MDAVTCVCVVVGYLAVLVGLYGLQRSLLYGGYINRVTTSPAAAGLESVKALLLTTADGESLSAWFVAPSDDLKPFICIFMARRARCGSARVISRPCPQPAWGCWRSTIAASAVRPVRHPKRGYLPTARPPIGGFWVASPQIESSFSASRLELGSPFGSPASRWRRLSCYNPPSPRLW